MHRHTQPSKLPILYLLNSAFICLIRRGPETPQWPTLYSNNWKLKCPKCQSSLCLIGWCNTVVFLLYKKQFKKAHSTLNMQVFRGWSLVQKSHHDKAISYYTNFNIKKHLQDKTYIYLEQPKLKFLMTAVYRTISSLQKDHSNNPIKWFQMYIIFRGILNCFL